MEDEDVHNVAVVQATQNRDTVSREAASTLIHCQRSELDSETSNRLKMLKRIIHDNPMMGLFDKNSYSSCLTKKLTKSDIDESQGRLIISIDFAKAQILPLLKEGVEDSHAGIPVTIYTRLNEFKMIYKCWNNKTHVLTSGWNEFWKECQLKVDDTIYLWVFRHVSTKKLCFAITADQD
ncbi:B3 DNA binding domain [Macleaya cordata]|uniref:B3 DNA binding domain n=1 Tax=Macleaya cordata TaxID=56857 RepID=A0A200QKN8_MACCD|nr:B3 DNA binding domain [Macleaya cordata]